MDSVGANKMAPDHAILRKAMAQIDRERSYLRAEQSSFQEFREAVSLTQPDQKSDLRSSETMEKLRETYRKEVMEALDHETIYGDTLAESLEQELPPALADALLSNEPFTHRRKRNLLVACTEAIERREQFAGELDAERNSLETVANELTEIEAVIDKLPECAPQRQPLEKLLVIWEVYDTLEERCAQLLEDRQRQLDRADRSIGLVGEKHALNDYLYRELGPSFPILSALASTLEQIDSNRNGEKLSEFARGSL